MRTVTPDDYQVISRVIHRYWLHMSDDIHTELRSAGHLGLARAAARFEHDHPSGITFQNFAWTYVYRAMQDALRAIDHLSRRDRAKIRSGEVVRLDGTAIMDDAPSALEATNWADITPDPVDEIARAEDAHAVQWALAQCTARERFVVGCVDLADWPLRDVADVLGVSESRVSQLRTAAHKRMRVLLAGALNNKEAA